MDEMKNTKVPLRMRSWFSFFLLCFFPLCIWSQIYVKDSSLIHISDKAVIIQIPQEPQATIYITDGTTVVNLQNFSSAKVAYITKDSNKNRQIYAVEKGGKVEKKNKERAIIKKSVSDLQKVFINNDQSNPSALYITKSNLATSPSSNNQKKFISDNSQKYIDNIIPIKEVKNKVNKYENKRILDIYQCCSFIRPPPIFEIKF
ncbi:hypothetical protein G6R40_01940 [Chryseobacterium sp. POL2]|uniref:hypothetical protein n=1 Tax=Chryseobacterium sp. POL2 TaxID=2713414 RepID=UPI0013E17606|nr:hypothetical protein [Chryseobacterium sp. POL2]QIG88493.1 hypothetical protein G6R40_01940 [Chryseobacterium sp. POL2]